ncbi:hypothetical protein Plhal304r1_c015g0056011 [Plasmopara halstedii]
MISVFSCLVGRNGVRVIRRKSKLSMIDLCQTMCNNGWAWPTICTDTREIMHCWCNT